VKTARAFGDVGITGNGHMMMLEKNNQDIAAFMAGLVDAKTSSEAGGPQIAETPAE